MRAASKGWFNSWRERKPALQFFKGQIVGPITFGLATQDGHGQDIIHNEVAFDAFMKGLLLRGRWIIRRMKTVCEDVIFFIDEPGLSGYGSAFFSVDGSTITRRLNEVIEEFQAQGGVGRGALLRQYGLVDAPDDKGRHHQFRCLGLLGAFFPLPGSRARISLPRRSSGLGDRSHFGIHRPRKRLKV